MINNIVENKYDIIVIGAGLSGLSAAAYSAKAGKKVIVLEQDVKPGGCYASFFRRGVVFDITAHWTVDHEKVNRMLAELNAPPIEFQQRPDVGEYIGPEKKRGILLLSNDRAKLERSIQEHYPQATKHSIDRLISLSLKVENELSLAKPKSSELTPSIIRVAGMLPLLFRMRTVLKYARMPAEKLLLELFPGDELKGLRITLYSIAPIKDIPAIGILAFIGFALKGRAYEPVGGAYKTGIAFENAVIRNGGEIRYSTKVKKITFDKKSVSGVILENGEMISAPNVITAISARQTFKELIPSNLVPSSYIEKLGSTPISDPYVIATIVSDIDLPNVATSEAVDMFVSSAYDIKTNLEMNNPEQSFFSIQFTRYHTEKGDSKLLGIELLSPVSYEYENMWRTGQGLKRGEEYIELKNEFAGKLLNRAESYIPGLKEHVLSLEVATPVTMYRYTLNTSGAPVGWSYASRSHWKQRIPFVKGLYGAGHWYGPSGIFNVALSGKNAAILVLRDTGYKEQDKEKWEAVKEGLK
jgi:phytoene dehydrogenase-like protein